MLYYKASCTSTKLEFGVADIRNNKRSMGRESEVELSTSDKRGFRFRGPPRAAGSGGNHA